MALIKRIDSLVVSFGEAPGWLPPGAAKPLAQKATLQLEIHRTAEGFFLVSSSDNEHFSGGDTWHRTLAEALAQAEQQFGARADDWRDAP